MKTWLVGENNPYGNPPRFDLYPYPERSSGHRLCYLLLGVDRKLYLDEERFHRVNLLRASKWSAPAARESAAKVRADATGCPVVLLGQKVSLAFGLDYKPFTLVVLPDLIAAIVPHPSGLNRAWNEEGSFYRARHIVHCAEKLAAGELKVVSR